MNFMRSDCGFRRLGLWEFEPKIKPACISIAALKVPSD